MAQVSMALTVTLSPWRRLIAMRIVTPIAMPIVGRMNRARQASFLEALAGFMARGAKISCN